jgi:O-antigen ligase
MLVSSFWLVTWAAFLSWCWLLPNHYPPWTSFHMDAWAATMFLPMAGAVLWRTRADACAPMSGIAVLALCALPWLQYGLGLIQLAGTSWMPFAYLLGLALAIFVGQRWETRSPAQVGDGLFLAIGIAALGSVGLQLHQWLQLNWFDVWSMGNGHGRPFANFGQPNQLGTLLLWGVLAFAWAAWRRHIRPGVAIFATVFVLFGVALTASRTAWIGIVGLTALAWYWRAWLPKRTSAWLVAGLPVCFFALVWIVPVASQGLLLSSTEGELEALARVSSELRPQVWMMFMDALGHRPWFGYGWNQVVSAQLAVATDFPPLAVLFGHTHNLFLDLLIWNGVPLGLIVSGLMVFWMWRRFRAIRDPGSALLFLTLAVVANHAMLELPLHYAYFLLPAGLIVGALDVRLKGRMVALRPRWLVPALWLASAALLAIMVRDYARIEASYQVLRFEWANVPTNASREPPDVLLLGPLRDVIVLSRFEPSANITDGQLDNMRRVANLFPTAGVIHKLAAALVWRDQADEARLWLRRLCALSNADRCRALKIAWENQAKTDPLIAKVPWPN